jgi:hypothetical protein
MVVNTRKLLLNTRILLPAHKNCYFKSLESHIKSEWERHFEKDFFKPGSFAAENIIVSTLTGKILLIWQQVTVY